MFNNLRFISKYIFPVVAGVIFTTGCSNDKFHIKGEIYGAEEKSLVLEKSDFHGRWIPVDSIKTNRNGGFSLSFPAPASPDIYRLALNNQFIYFPIDSTETITLTSSYDKFGHDFSLSGSKNAEKMAQFEKELQKANVSDSAFMDQFKRNVYSNYMKDAPGSILGYYILTKTVDGKPLYDASYPADRKYFSAVANGYMSNNPNDPHSKLLEEVAIHALKQKNKDNGLYREIEANEITLIDMDLQDEKGENVKLSDIAGKNKPVVVIFSLLNQPESPELNIRLAQIYNRLGGKVEFYNVSLDEDQYAWREAAKNLPWITVYSPGQGSSEDAVRYHAFQLPSFYIYNANGELTSRPMTLEELNQSLQK